MPPADDDFRKIENTKVLHASIIFTAASTVPQNPHPANPIRNFLAIWNTGANIGYLRFGQPNRSTATAANGDIPILPGGSLMFIFQVPIDAVYLTSPVGATSFTTIEGLRIDPRLRGKFPHG